MTQTKPEDFWAPAKITPGWARTGVWDGIRQWEWKEQVQRLHSTLSKWTLRLAHGRHFIFMSAGLPIPFPLQTWKEALNKLFGWTVFTLDTLKQTTPYTGSQQPHRRGQGSDVPADVERRAQVSPIFTPHQLQGLPTGLHKSPEFFRCRSESMSQPFHRVGTPSLEFPACPPTHTSLRLPLAGIHCTPGGCRCQPHLKALLSIQPLLSHRSPIGTGLTVVGAPNSVVFPGPLLGLWWPRRFFWPAQWPAPPQGESFPWDFRNYF